MTTRRGQVSWIKRLLGNVTSQQERAAIRYHERVLHDPLDPSYALGRAVRDIGRAEAEQVLGELRVRKMDRNHDPNHSL